MLSSYIAAVVLVCTACPSDGHVLSCVPVLPFAPDSHLHVWGDGEPPFTYASGQEPPERLRASSSPETLIGEMDKAGVGGALIVQVCSIENRPRLTRPPSVEAHTTK